MTKELLEAIRILNGHKIFSEIIKSVISNEHDGHIRNWFCEFRDSVEDVIKNILSVKREWGSIFVILKQLNIKKEFEIKYENEKILPMSEYERGMWHILQFLKVKSMRGYGGWSASDYWLEVKI